MPLDPTYEERALYTVAGEIEIAGDASSPGQLLVFRPATASRCGAVGRALHDARRRADGRAALHLVELRLLAQGADRAGQGRLGAGLGVVELTVALHYVFDTPRDRLIWDVGHQAYPHKILTGRRDRIRTLRQGGGLSGFTKRAESEYDPFGAAHSSTSISAGLGMAVARDLDGRGATTSIAVIGDGAMSAGMAYEAMNNAGAMHSRLIVILNDNDMSIAPPVGAMSAYLARLVSGGTYRGLREIGEAARQALPKFFYEKAARAEEFTRGFWTGGTCSRSWASTMSGRSTGTTSTTCCRSSKTCATPRPGPILVHVVTQKGKGYAPRRGVRRQVPRRRHLRRGHRRAGEAEGERTVLHQGVRREPDPGGAEGRQDRRDHGRHAVRHRARSLREAVPERAPSMSASPSSTP